MSAEPIIHEQDAVLVCGTWENAIISAVRGKYTKDILLRLDAVHDVLATRFPITLAVSIAAVNAPLPDKETRELSTTLIKKRPAESVVSAVILEGQGFWSAGARALVSTLFLVANTTRKNKVFASPEDAAAWAAPLSGRASVTAEGLAAATRSVRTILG